MDITGASDQRRQLGVERFASGEDTLAYEGVVFSKERTSSLVVASFSECLHIENVTADEATRKIERSKQVLSQLKTESSAFAAAIDGLNCKYDFCFDYGTGSVKVATLDGEIVKWLR